MKKILITLTMALLAVALFAQTKQNPWQDTPESSFASKSALRRIVPAKYRSLSLDLDLLKTALSEAPMRFSPQAENAQPTLTIPMPDGTMQEFQVVEAPVMHPDLAAQYPFIRSYAGWSNADRTAYLRCGYTQKGFHAMILSANHSTVYIDIYAEGDDAHYISYFKKDYPNPHNFECMVNATAPNHQSPITNHQSLVVGDCQHRNYALALACTGEYAAFHGGTKPLVLAEFNVAMTRINGIYERELAVTMTMVANTDLLIFLNANTDPYTNNDGGTMLNENQLTCNNIIGNANYDIGHVFSTGGGGVAQLNSVCSMSGKARGVTGLGSPIGDGFYVDYVCHEMGHQFGGNHTQNNSCNRNDATAMEPGSGSTIMGYAGVCSPNVQPNSDDYFHAINLGEIHNHLLGAGNACATTTATGNNAPIVSVTANSFTLPISTPFVLTAQGLDTDPSDALTYCWEQMNNQVGTQPPLSTNTLGPVFRTFDPSTSPKRYFPNLPAIIAGTTPTWEVLPAVARSMSFRCTLRDNHPGAGCTDEADVSLTFNAAAGPFVVTNPNTSAVTWTGGSTATVAWNVANTNNPPVAASQVEILLSADGGTTYPYTLSATTANDGTESVLVPNIATLQARVMVKAKANIFFDISNQNFKIEMAVVPSFTLLTSPSTAAACQSGQASYGFSMLQLAGFNLPVSFTATGVPAGATAVFTPNNLPPPATVGLTIGNLGGVTAGTYPITVTAIGGTVTQTSNIVLVVLDQVTAAAALSSPADGAEVTAFQPTLTWGAVANASEYLVEVSKLPSFNSIFATGTPTTNSWQVSTPCVSLNVYYWRVRAQNPCSQSAFSQTFAFHLGGIGCQTFNATGLPLTIPLVATSVTKTLNVPANLSISSVQTSMNIDHSYVGDLSAELTSPQGTTLQIFDRPGVPASSFGCEGDDITANFADSYTDSAMVFENTCSGTTPTISGNYQPMAPFAGFNSQSSQGNWSLKITDSYDDDGGALLNWSLDICGLVPSPLAVLLKNDVLTVPQGQSADITQNYLQGQSTDPDGMIYTLLSLPTNGILLLFGGQLQVGGYFTQDEIDAGLVTYQHDGSMTTSDQFVFDCLDGDGHWLHAQVFHINIIQNTLAAAAAITQAVSCFGVNNGEITVAASGGSAPLEYSLNGGAFQSSNVFSGLAPGTYTVEVMDANGFTFTTNDLTLTNPPALTVSASVTTDDITAAGSGGTGSLQYSIGGPFQPGSTFSDQPNGVYTVTVMDANGCTATSTAIVAVNTLIVTASVTGGISCFGVNDGEVTVTAAGGMLPYLYSMNGGALQGSNVFLNLAAGTYSFEVVDADGFTQSITNITLSNPAQLTASASASGNSITVTASGGTGSLQYSLNGGPFQSSSTFNNLPNGPYTLTVMDANGCTTTATATVSVNNIVVSGSVTEAISCFGENDGVITATASGGMAPYQYSLNGGAFQTSPVFSGLVAGSYTVTTMDGDGLAQTSQPITLTAPPQINGSAIASGYTVTVTASGGTGSLQYSLDGGAFQPGNLFTPVASGIHSITVRDANGCTTTVQVTVTVPALAVSGSISQPINCPGGTDGQITALGSGGVPAYQYSLNGGAFQGSNTFSNLAAGSYVLTIKDSGGFVVSSATIILTAPPAMVVNPSASGNTVTVAASGGTPPYQFQLDNGALQTSNIFNGVGNGTHPITVVDAHGCEQTGSVFVGGTPPNIFVSLSQPVSCHGSADAAITVNGSGGTPPYQYSLNGGAFQTGNTFTGLAAGTYAVAVMGADGAMTTAPSIFIPDPPALSVTATVFGLAIAASGTGGTGDYEYSLDGVNFDNENVLEASGNGNFTVTIMDEHGCTATTTVNVHAVVGATLNVDGVSCFGETDGQIEIAGVTGGTAPYQYAVNGGAFSSQTTYTGLAPGDYTIRVKDATGYEFEAPTIVVAEPDALLANFQLALNNLTIVASGGTGQLMYSVNGGTTFQSGNVFNDLPLGTYPVVVKDENGCTFTGQVIVDMSATDGRLGSLVFEVLPNPSDGLFILKMDLPTFASLDLAVYDVVGRRLFASQIAASGALQQPLDLRFLASGAYLLRVGDGEQWGVRKLVVLGR